MPAHVTLTQLAIDLAVRVPADVVNGYEGASGLDEAAREQTTLPDAMWTVALTRSRRLASQIERAIRIGREYKSVCLFELGIACLLHRAPLDLLADPVEIGDELASAAESVGVDRAGHVQVANTKVRLARITRHG